MKISKPVLIGIALLLCALAIFIIRIAASAGRRDPPIIVKPVTLGAVEYRATNEAESEGMVEARDIQSGRLLWKKKIYLSWKLPHFILETDVQLNFITNITVGPAGDELTIANEKGKQYILNTTSQTVRRR